MATPPKGPADGYMFGDWNAVCFQCGRKRKASELKKHWQGYWVCPEHWEPRHEQDFVRAGKEEQPVPWSQPGSDVMLPQCTLVGLLALPDYALPDCVTPSFFVAGFLP